MKKDFSGVQFVAPTNEPTEAQIGECCNILKDNGVNTDSMTWGTLTKIAKAMIEFKGK